MHSTYKGRVWAYLLTELSIAAKTDRQILPGASLLPRSSGLGDSESMRSVDHTNQVLFVVAASAVRITHSLGKRVLKFH